MEYSKFLLRRLNYKLRFPYNLNTWRRYPLQFFARQKPFLPKNYVYEKRNKINLPSTIHNANVNSTVCFRHPRRHVSNLHSTSSSSTTSSFPLPETSFLIASQIQTSNFFWGQRNFGWIELEQAMDNRVNGVASGTRVPLNASFSHLPRVCPWIRWKPEGRANVTREKSPCGQLRITRTYFHPDIVYITILIRKDIFGE